MNVFILKMIACITMLIDHIGHCFIPPQGDTEILYLACRSIGRIAFPIFCFLIVEGFLHTRSLKKYIIRLSVFAVISEFAYDFGFNFMSANRWYLQQNVFLTLLVGLIVIATVNYLFRTYAHNPVIYNTAATITIVLGSLLVYLLRTDYSYKGIIYILIFYFFRGRKVLLCLIMSAVVIAFYGQDSLFVLNAHTLLALIPICLYNGKKGPSAKYAFYAFYPAHLILFGLIRILK